MHSDDDDKFMGEKGTSETLCSYVGDRNLLDRRIASVYTINHPWHFGVSGKKPKA